jgi:flagellar biosynthesis GTPase FlhF
VLDTPRVSPGDRTAIRRLGRMLGELEPERVIVAMPATLSGAAAAQLLESLAPLKPNAMIVTHAEETDQIGVTVEAACRFGLAPEYILDRGRPQGWRLTRLGPAELAAMVLR